MRLRDENEKSLGFLMTAIVKCVAIVEKHKKLRLFVLITFWKNEGKSYNEKNEQVRER